MNDKVLNRHNLLQHRKQTIKRCPGPIDTSKTQTPEPKAQETSRKSGQEDCKSQTTSNSAMRLILLEMTEIFHPWCLNNMAA